MPAPADTHTGSFSSARRWPVVAGVRSGSGSLSASVDLHAARRLHDHGELIDDDGGIGARSSAHDVPAFVVVYDPTGSFVTGGGWIESPAGALWTTDVSGKASFGFVAKYKHGASTPSGNTEFQFKAGDLSFKSTATTGWSCRPRKRSTRVRERSTAAGATASCSPPSTVTAKVATSPTNSASRYGALYRRGRVRQQDRRTRRFSVGNIARRRKHRDSQIDRRRNPWPRPLLPRGLGLPLQIRAFSWRAWPVADRGRTDLR